MQGLVKMVKGDIQFHLSLKSTMPVFQEYSKFYDTIYEKKDYDAEVDFILSLAAQHGCRPRRVLDIGCGTGGHIISLCKRNLYVKGFDQSAQMLSVALEKIKTQGFETQTSVTVGDARSFRGGEKYDFIIAMFAVVGYLTTYEDIIACFKTAAFHMDPGGLLTFDVWFGPTVLNELPETRIQEYSIDGSQVFRLVRPKIDVLRNTVEVRYDIHNMHNSDRIVRTQEVHVMRFFFLEELRLLLDLAGLRYVAAVPFMDASREPRLGDWNISIVAKLK